MQTIFPGTHEFPLSTWCLSLQVRFDADVYDVTWNDANINCHTCGKNMYPFRYHSLATCGSGYGRTASYNHIARDITEQVLVASGIPFRLEKIGILPDADNCPGDIFVSTAAGFTDASFRSAAIDLEINCATPDYDK